MKNLMLIRHGKSSWEITIPDKERPLINSGILDIKQVAEAIRADLPKKFQIWSSSAKRTTETATIFAQKILYPFENIEFKDDLYTFDFNEFEKNIKSCNNDCDFLIVFGHNSAITDIANKFGNSYIMNIPTSGMVLIEIDADSWNNIKKGNTKKIIFPKELN